MRYTFEYENEFQAQLFINNLTSSNFTNSSFNEAYLDLFLRKNYQLLIIDYVSDLVYLLDIFLIQTRMKYLNEGIWTSDFKLTFLNYIKSYKFLVNKH